MFRSLAMAAVLWMITLAPVSAEEGRRLLKYENHDDCFVWSEVPQQEETVTWDGSCKDGRAEGHGTERWRFKKDGEWVEETFTGTMENEQLQGIVVVVLADGARFEGEYRDGVAHGRGKAWWSDGGRYEGEWHEGQAHGTGRLWKSDGYRYEGQFKDHLEHGEGKAWWPDGARYEGEWHEGKADGAGTLWWDDGSRYEGEFWNHKFHGQGKIWFGNGHWFEGTFVDDQPKGRGTYYWWYLVYCEADWLGWDWEPLERYGGTWCWTFDY